MSGCSKEEIDAQAVSRQMRLEDIPQICEIEAESFTTPWTPGAFQNELTYNQFARYYVLELDSTIIAYGGMWTIMDEAHVTNIAVRSHYRGRGYGQQILQELMVHAACLGMQRMTLEVRVSNQIAQNLYEKMGFYPAGIRKSYYSDNQEDALIMWADLDFGTYGTSEGRGTNEDNSD